MTAKCICFVGNSLGGTQFRDKVNDADIEGNLFHQFETIMDFFTRNLRHIQVGDEFNSKGVLEIPYTSLVEFTVNALVHRSLNAKALSASSSLMIEWRYTARELSLMGFP